MKATWTPDAPSEMIGEAARIAGGYVTAAPDWITGDKPPLKLMLYGPPGSGKSAICKLVADALTEGNTAFNVDHVNGKQMGIEFCRDISRRFGLTSLYGAYQGIWCDEIDAASLDAQKHMLTMLDDLPPGWLFICTTNRDPRDEKQMEKRFVSRFIRHEISHPEIDEVRRFLITRFDADPQVASAAAYSSFGNVRQAILDLDAAEMFPSIAA